MKEIKIEKLVINLCVGESGDKLTNAAKVSKRTKGDRRFDGTNAVLREGEIHDQVVRHQEKREDFGVRDCARR